MTAYLNFQATADYNVNFLASGAYDRIGDNRNGTLDVSHGNNAVYKEVH